MNKKTKLIHIIDENIQELEVILLEKTSVLLKILLRKYYSLLKEIEKKSDNDYSDILNKISLYEEEMKEFK